MAFLPLIHGQEITLPIAVKRVHSRHRRFIAPGAVWDLMIGVEAIGRDFEFRHDLVHHYRMDYLFGGTSALAGAIAGANAAVTASNAAIAAASAAAAAAGKRKKRRLVLKCHIIMPFFNFPFYYSAAGTNPLAAGLGRSFSTDDDISNLLKRTIVDDQVDILGVVPTFYVLLADLFHLSSFY